MSTKDVRVLTKEQKKAFGVFLSYFSTANYNNHLYIEHIKELENIYITDLVFFTSCALETMELPKGNWSWNKSRQTIDLLVNGILVSFYKLNARKIDEPVARKKVWIFDITFPNSNQILHFYWCEKGDQIQTVQFGLHDLAFLKEFVPIDACSSLGWNFNATIPSSPNTSLSFSPSFVEIVEILLGSQ